MKIRLLWALGFACLSLLSGCKLTSIRTPAENVSWISVQEVASSAAKLIEHLRTADEGTVAVKADREDDPLTDDLVHRTAELLKSQGYAVQEILPEDRLQKGDKGYEGGTAPKILIRLDRLNDSQMHQLRIVYAGSACYRMFAQQGRSLAPASGWVRQQNY